MADLASTDFLDHLKSIYPQNASVRGTKTVIDNPWYVLAAVGFGSCNRPEAVPLVFVNALEDLKKVQKEQNVDESTAHVEQLLLARRVREGILKGGLLCGASRVRSIAWMVVEFA